MEWLDPIRNDAPRVGQQHLCHRQHCDSRHWTRLGRESGRGPSPTTLFASLARRHHDRPPISGAVGGLVAIAMLAGLTAAVVFAAIAAVFLIGSAFYRDTRLSRPINRARKLLGKPAVEAEIVDGSVGMEIVLSAEHVEATPTVVTVYSAQMK